VKRRNGETEANSEWRVAKGRDNGTTGPQDNETTGQRTTGLEKRRNGDTEKRRNFTLLRITHYALRITNHDSRITEVFLPCAEFVGL
jgi:hypothetical protein